MWCGANSDPPSWPHHPSERRGDGVETSSPLEPGNLPGSRLFFGWPGILPGQLLAHSCPIHRSRNDQRPPDLRGSPGSEAFEGPRFPHGPVHLAHRAAPIRCGNSAPGNPPKPGATRRRERFATGFPARGRPHRIRPSSGRGRGLARATPGPGPDSGPPGGSNGPRVSHGFRRTLHC